MADQNEPLPPLYMQDENGVLHPVDPAQLQQWQQDGVSRQAVHVTRPFEPTEPTISEEVRQKSAESRKQYPDLNLSECEYVIFVVKRHLIGLVPIWGLVGVLVLVSLIAVYFYATNVTAVSQMFLTSPDRLPSVAALGVFLLLVLTIFILGAVIATHVYRSNRFILTNESVIQIIRPSLFSTHQQTVSLGSIEDAGYFQNGIMQSLFNYGLLRLSTVGDETTYRFNYVSNPKSQAAILNNAVEAFKNGRPVVD